MQPAALTPTPAHVPEALVLDFDFLNPEGAHVDPFEALRRLHQAPPLFWTPRNQGHWVATRGSDIKAILADQAQFSSSSAFIPITNRPRAVPLEMDPPEHLPYRRLVMPAFTPPKVAGLSTHARALAIELIEGLLPLGRCEFMADFAQQLPIIIFMKMCDLPLQDREQLLHWVGTSLRPGEQGVRDQARDRLAAYNRRLLAERREHPGDDLVSQLVNAEIDGQRIPEAEAFGILSGLLGGGLDTVTASMGWAALFLARHPAHRAQLVADPSLIPGAVDELLRRYSVANIARVIKQDMVYGGVQLKAGEQVLLSACLQGMDPQQYEQPLVVDFKRKDARTHAAFSNGPHRCPGSLLAQAELRIFMEEWLQRLPDFELDPSRPLKVGTGIVHGVESLPLRWAV